MFFALLCGCGSPAAPPGAPETAEAPELPARPVSQALVPEDVARDELSVYLDDRTAAAAPGEVAPRPPWSTMGRHVQAPRPFGWRKPREWQQDKLPAGPGIHQLTALVDTELYGRAEALARARLAADPKDAQTAALLGWVLTELDRIDEAEVVLEALLEDYPGYVDGWVELGILRSNDRRLEESLAAFDHALALREGWEVRLGRGIALCRADRFEEAEYDLWKAVEADPDDGNAYYDLAWIAAQRGDGPTAANLLRFAARSPRLLAVRVCRRVLREDAYFEPVWGDPAFEAYLKRLPLDCLVRERNSPLTPSELYDGR